MTLDEKYDHEFREKLRELMQAGLPDDVLTRLRKHIKDFQFDLEDQTEAWLKDELAERLSDYVEQMATRAVESMLEGNEAMLRRYLQCERGGYTGRDRDHPVIHGELFEYGGLKARKQIVDAYPELLKNERIQDLEDQVRSLVEQVRKLEARNRQLVEYLNHGESA